MSDRLTDLTEALVGELHESFDRHTATPQLDDAMCAYVGYWRKMGASSTRIVEFAQRLIDRARGNGATHPSDAREADALVAEVLARCFTLASEPRSR